MLFPLVLSLRKKEGILYIILQAWKFQKKSETKMMLFSLAIPGCMGWFRDSITCETVSPSWLFLGYHIHVMTKTLVFEKWLLCYIILNMLWRYKQQTLYISFIIIIIWLWLWILGNIHKDFVIPCLELNQSWGIILSTREKAWLRNRVGWTTGLSRKGWDMEKGPGTQ